jgi:hypothetical protein
MIKYKLVRFTIVLFTSIMIFSSCETTRKVTAIIGKYTTTNLKPLDVLKLMWQYGAANTYQLEMVLDLKKDSTFQIGFCQRKIVFDGNWKVDGDSIVLYNVFNYYLGRQVDAFKVYREPKKMTIFFPIWTRKIVKNKDTIITNYTLLKIDGKGFDGILDKGFLHPRDSILRN